jgi:hypothetical protein
MITLNAENSDYKDEFTKLIYINKYSLSPDLCLKIIDLYEKTSLNKGPGRTAGGVNEKAKTTTDLMTHDQAWRDFNTTLHRELKHNINLYAKSLDHNDYKGVNNNTDPGNDYMPIATANISRISQFMIQKYQKNKGRYVYHNDFMLVDNSECRVITYLWYLNDVTEGGETAFNGTYNIKPKQGTLVLFPASWTFPHCGKMPVSSDKYIITGWIYAMYACDKK